MFIRTTDPQKFFKKGDLSNQGSSLILFEQVLPTFFYSKIVENLFCNGRIYKPGKGCFGHVSEPHSFVALIRVIMARYIITYCRVLLFPSKSGTAESMICSMRSGNICQFMDYYCINGNNVRHRGWCDFNCARFTVFLLNWIYNFYCKLTFIAPQKGVIIAIRSSIMLII